MRDRYSFEEIKAAALVLDALLQAPEAELSSWKSAVELQVQKIVDGLGLHVDSKGARMQKAFRGCTETKRRRDGSVWVRCKLGLWYVCGPDAERVLKDAYHYWIQYFEDGEYDEMLKETNQ